MKTIDLTNQVFGHLTVLKRAAKQSNRIAWLCQCDCGNQVIVQSKNLLNGHTISCKHIKRDVKKLRDGYNDKRKDNITVFLLENNRKIRSDNTTGITGVKKHLKRDGSIDYQAEITVSGTRHHLGTYSTIEEAKQSRKNAERRLIPHERI